MTLHAADDPDRDDGLVRVVRGAATGPTALAAYDAALAEAGVHNYNLVPVSSVVPPGAAVEVVETAPDLGRTGNRLTVVQSRLTVPPGGDAGVAGVGWVTTAAGGLLYEGAGATETEVRAEIEAGLAAGCERRDWPTRNPDLLVQSTPPDPEGFGTAVVLAVYGRSEPIL